MSRDFARLIEERRAVEFAQRDVPGSFNPPLVNGNWVEVDPPKLTLFERATGPMACAALLAAVMAAGLLMFAAIIGA